MANPYETLGVSLADDDQTVRQKYLELTRAYPPEQQPEMAAKIRHAYERIRTAKLRAEYWIFGDPEFDGIGPLIEELECTKMEQQISFQDLMQMALKTPQ